MDKLKYPYTVLLLPIYCLSPHKLLYYSQSTHISRYIHKYESSKNSNHVTKDLKLSNNLHSTFRNNPHLYSYPSARDIYLCSCMFIS